MSSWFVLPLPEIVYKGRVWTNLRWTRVRRIHSWETKRRRVLWARVLSMHPRRHGHYDSVRPAVLGQLSAGGPLADTEQVRKGMLAKPGEWQRIAGARATLDSERRRDIVLSPCDTI